MPAEQVEQACTTHQTSIEDANAPVALAEQPCECHMRKRMMEVAKKVGEPRQNRKEVRRSGGTAQLLTTTTFDFNSFKMGVQGLWSLLQPCARPIQ